MLKIKEISISGLKSIKHLDCFLPGQINLLIGPNGAGKSNLVFFFNMLSWMVKSPNRFQEKVAEWGNASGLLFRGQKETSDILGHLGIETEAGLNEYAFRLHAVGGDKLIFAEERVRFTNPQIGAGKAEWKSIGDGGKESKLFEQKSTDRTIKVVEALLKRIYVYQFHDTGPSSKIRNSWSRGDGENLKDDAGNLGSFLLHLQENHSAHYTRLIRYIREVIPDFHDFQFPDNGPVLLQWREKNADYLFSSYQASDGMLRFFALVALLSQPPEKMAPVIFIDEPELGLHPQAIVFLASLIRSASKHSQLFISTQSPGLVSQFEPEEIVVVEKKEGISTYQKQDREKLQSWLDEFTMGEIWNHNLIGGRP